MPQDKSRVIFLILAVSASFIALVGSVGYVAKRYLGPGLADYSKSIAGGYEVNDSGGLEQNIVYLGDEAQKQIVVDSQVVDYVLIDNDIYVARRPRIIVESDAPRSTLAHKCEYWRINIDTHRAMQIFNAHGLECRR